MANPLDQLVQQQQDPNALPGAPMPPGMPGSPNPDMAGGAPMPGGSPDMAGGQSMATPEQMQELQGLLGGVQNANAQLVTKQLVDRNEISLMRKQLLGKLFELLSQAGIDPSNPESVKAFLQQLETQDPDLLAIFTAAFHDLQNGPMQGLMPEDQGAPAGGNPLDMFRNLSRGTMDEGGDTGTAPPEAAPPTDMMPPGMMPPGMPPQQ